MPATVLIVEDEEPIQELLAYNFKAEGFNVRTLDGTEDVVREISNDTPDLILLDWMLPSMSGIEICRSLRARPDTRDVPIIMLTARKTEADRIAGLEMGADDYVVKPFSPQEVVSRVRAVLRRSGGSGNREDDVHLEFDGMVIDSSTRSVFVDGHERALTAKEFDLLHTLAQRPQHVFSRDQLLELVWGSPDYIDPSTVTVHIRRVREKIEAQPSQPRWITTVWGVGYRFEP